MANDQDNNISDTHWERDVLRRVALEVVQEQRRARRWNVFFRLAFLIYLTVALLLAVQSCEGRQAAVGPHAAVVKLEGPITEGAAASAEVIIKGLQAAFDAPEVAGVILQINSPGGSPVQSGIINDEIRRLRAEHPDIPLYVAVGDVCASGAYYVAAAADKIFVDKASMVGSIGVLIDSFGFTGTMDKLGIERRLYTAGESKGFLDPFSPEQPRDIAHVRRLLGEVHAQFIEVVKQGRGERLANDPSLFSGLIWSGERSIELGLADATGNVYSIARDVIGTEQLVDYTPRPDLFSEFAEQIGVSAARYLESALRGLQLR